MSNYLTAKEVAQKFHCSIATVRKWRKAKILVGERTGKGFIYKEEDLDEFFDRYKGYDISNPYKIDLATALKKNA